MTTITLNDEEIYYVRQGAGMGPPIIFIHGAGGSHRTWLKQVNALQNCTAYALDLPAHGESTGVGRDRVPPYADVLLAFLDGLQLSSAILVGHSLGGAIALWLALHKPQRVRGLVLADTGARLRVHQRILEAAKEGRPISLSILSDSQPATQPTTPADRAMADKEVVYGDWVACDTFDVMDRVQDIACPTLVIVGADDMRTPLKYSQYMADRIKGAKLVVVEEAGHTPMLEKPAEVTQAIQAFVNTFPIVPPQKQ